ncbi:MAG: YaaR family protein [Clostridiales bacterium]|jgi:uncharacterized protein YaaR (DUF327 family)|nr:YaaR family protein [Clostridiales bacterium]
MKIIDRRAEAPVFADVRPVDGDGSNEFGQKMDSKRASGDYREKLKNLLERIDQQAAKLADRLDIGELKRYRSLVAEFIDISVRHSSQYEKEQTLDARGRRRIFGIVKKIDAELETLAREVLKGQKDNLGVLAKLDDIRGMLVDIMA